MKSPSIIPYYIPPFFFEKSPHFFPKKTKNGSISPQKTFKKKNHLIFGEKIPALASRNRALLYEGSATPAARAAWRWTSPWWKYLSLFRGLSHGLWPYHMYLYIYIYILFIYLSIYLSIYVIEYKYIVLYNRLHPWDALQFFSNAEKHAENSVSRMVS